MAVGVLRKLLTTKNIAFLFVADASEVIRPEHPAQQVNGPD